MAATKSFESPDSDSNKALLYKSILFSLFFIVIWLFLRKTFDDNEDNIYLSELEITKTGLLSSGLIVGLWLIYLIFFMGDNTLQKLWEVFRLRGTFSSLVKIAVKWYILLLMLILSVFLTSPGLFSQINALSAKVIFKGDILLQEVDPSGKRFDHRFQKISIEQKTETLILEGNTNELEPKLNKDVEITLYQGIFFKYALVQK